MFTFQTTRRLQWVQTGIFNYLCGLLPINKILREKESCLPACLLSEFILCCCVQVEQRWETPRLLWKRKVTMSMSGHITPLGTKGRSPGKEIPFQQGKRQVLADTQACVSALPSICCHPKNTALHAAGSWGLLSPAYPSNEVRSSDTRGSAPLSLPCCCWHSHQARQIDSAIF